MDPPPSTFWVQRMTYALMWGVSSAALYSREHDPWLCYRPFHTMWNDQRNLHFCRLTSFSIVFARALQKQCFTPAVDYVASYNFVRRCFGCICKRAVCGLSIHIEKAKTCAFPSQQIELSLLLLL